jgi:BlaI family penicillinase repressor
MDMNRPSADALTERELEVMHVFWAKGQQSAQDARDELEKRGRNLTYTTVATLCKILWEKDFLERIGDARPFQYMPSKSFQEVSKNLVSDLIHRVFQGSREQLLLNVIGNKKLSKQKLKMLEDLLRDEEEGAPS